MVAFWERMRNICPKVNLYHGPIVGKDGEQCITSIDLDEAMLATRDFWFQVPEESDKIGNRFWTVMRMEILGR